MKKDLLTLLDLQPDQVKKLLERAVVLKKERQKGKSSKILANKTLAMVFEKPSTRTRASFDVAMYELGGHSIYIESATSQLGRGETYFDTGRVLSRYAHGVVVRTFSQSTLEEF